MIHHYDVVVIGGGIFGSAAAYNCQKNGQRTLLLEQFDLRHHHGSSHGKSRITRYAHTEEPYIPLVAEAYKELEDLENTHMQKLWRRTGLLWTDAKDEILKISDGLKKHGLEHSVIPGSEVNKTYPQFVFDDETAALIDPQGGVLFAEQILKAYHKEFERLGGRIHEREELLEYRDGTVRVQLVTNKSCYSADKVIITPGSWIGKLVPDLQKLFKIEPESMTVLYWGTKQQKQSKMLELGQFPCYIGKSKEHGSMFAMASVDHLNAVKFMSHHGQPYTVGEPHPQIARDSIAKPTDFITKHLPILNAAMPVNIERCKYTNSEDGHYIIDFLPGSKRILVGACGSGAGFKVAPAIGKVLAEMANDKKPSVDISFFSLSRFQGNQEKSKL